MGRAAGVPSARRHRWCWRRRRRRQGWLPRWCWPLRPRVVGRRQAAAARGPGSRRAHHWQRVSRIKSGTGSVPDAMQTLRQDMHEEATDELVRGEPHRFVTIATFAPIILPSERDAGLVGRDQTAVGDGDAVGVAREISQHSVRPGERRLSILPITKGRGLRSVIPIIRFMAKPPSSCARSIAMGNAIFA